MNFAEILKSIFLGIVEGLTEWLPISSTGHMILVNSFMKTDGFLTSDLYLYVIQFGAILAVVTMFFGKLNPFSPSKSAQEKKDTWDMWFKVIAACVPAGVFGLLLDNYMEHFENPYVIASTLIIYGILFIITENLNKTSTVNDMKSMTYKTALLIGMFQVLSIVPGTSRSGATILGAIMPAVREALPQNFRFSSQYPLWSA